MCISCNFYISPKTHWLWKQQQKQQYHPDENMFLFIWPSWWKNRMDLSENSGTPQIIHFDRVFHYKPSILGYPYFWKHPDGFTPSRCAPKKSTFLICWSFKGRMWQTTVKVIVASIKKWILPGFDASCRRKTWGFLGSDKRYVLMFFWV